MTNDMQIQPMTQAADTPLARTQTIDIGAVIQSALQAGRPMSELVEAFELFERMESVRREAAYNEAFARFHQMRPPVKRKTENQQFMVTRSGVKKPSMYASKNDIMDSCGSTLSTCGLSIAWGSPEVRDGYVHVPCIVSHREGFSRTTSYPFPTTGDTRNTNPAPAQRWASILSYAERYSLKAALGLTDVDDDDVDGNEANGEPISEEQVKTLEEMIVEVGADRMKYLKYLGVSKLADVPTPKFDHAVKALKAKQAK